MTEMYQNNTGNRSDDYLDMEYLTTLRNIKPYITCIMNNHYIELIRVWLEKLSDIHIQHDKSLRNVYLVELGKQIVTGVFAEPFIDPPGEGSLPPFKYSWKFTKDKNISPQENTDGWTQSDSNNVSTQVIMDLTKCSSQSISEGTIKNERIQQSYAIKQENDTPSPKSQLHDVKEKLALVREYSKQICRKNAKKKKSKSKKQINIHTVSQRKMSDDTDIYPERYSGGRVEVPYREVRVYSPLRKLKHCDRKFNETDDSSWFDLTDCSTNVTPAFCSGDGEGNGRMYNQEDIVQMQDIYEKKIAELVAIISDLKEENCNLATHVEKCENELSISTFCSLKNRYG